MEKVFKFWRGKISGTVRAHQQGGDDKTLTDTDVHVNELSDAFILLVEEEFKAQWGTCTMGRGRILLSEAGEFVSLPNLAINSTGGS